MPGPWVPYLLIFRTSPIVRRSSSSVLTRGVSHIRSNHHIRFQLLFSGCVFNADMSFSRKGRESLASPQDGAFPMTSRPVSPSSPSFVSHGPRDSIASSTYPMTPGASSSNLLQYPRPTYLHHNSSSSSLQSDFDGATIVQTPGVEKPWLEGELSRSKFSRMNGSTNSFFKKFEPESYSIETLNKNDDVDLLVPWKRFIYRFSPLFTFFACASYFLYYAYRIYCTVIAQRAYHRIYVMAWLFIAAEGCVACM